MAQGGVAPSIPKADFSAGGAGTGATLPLSRDDMDTPGSSDVLVHFKVCSDDPEVVRRVTGTIQNQMAGQRVGSRGIAVIITDDSIEMAQTTKQIIAAQIAPLVSRMLGIPEGIGR